MMAAWMLYCTLCALGLSVAALLAERALLAGRGTVRQIWLGAVVLSLLVPVIAFRYAPRRAAVTTVSVGQGFATDEPVVDGTSLATPSTSSPTQSSPSRWSWGTMLARADQPLAIAWLALSLALALHFALSVMALARTRRRWGSRVVLGVPVLVSEQTGPALVGAVSPAIVVPEWVFGLESGQLTLMLRHEQEHQRAHDGQLLFAAQFALIAMPWNVALWYQILRLRVAIELDCDARVLRDADTRSYGDLLLAVVGPRTALTAVGAASFVEHATQLERRIRVMAERRNRAVRGARMVAAFVALAAVAIAWIAPRPPVPALAPAQQPAPLPATTAAPATRPAELPPTARDVERPKPEKAAPKTIANAPADSSRTGLMASSRNEIDTGSARGAAPTRPDTAAAVAPQVPAPLGLTRLLDPIYSRLFDGITLAPDQEAKARAVLAKVLAEQIASQDSAQPAITAYNARMTELRSQRDSAFMALLTNDVDRATLTPRITPGARGARVGGPPAAQNPTGSGRIGGGGGGRVGGAGVPGVAPPDPAQLVESAFRRLFDGIALTLDQEAGARAALAKFQAGQRALVPPRIAPRVALLPGGDQVVIEARSDSALMELLTNDSDRQKLRARMITLRPIPPGGSP